MKWEVWRFKIWLNPPFLWKCLYQVRIITVFTVFQLLTDYFCLYTIFLTFLLTSLSLYIFTIWKSIVYYRFCRDRIYFHKIFVSEYKLPKRSNKIWTYTSNLTTVVNSVLKFMINGTTSILKSYIFQICAAIYHLFLHSGPFNLELWRIYQWKKFCKSRIID
jgi:hypothetical protein